MAFRNAATRRQAGLVPWLCLLALAVVGCSPEQYPQTALLPLSDFARIGDHVQDQTFYWAVGVFILVEGALLYAIFRFRGRPDDPEPKQVHGNTTVEIIWTVIPALILAAIAVPTVKGIFQTNTSPGPDALRIEVIGHQWWWEFRYPEAGVVTANELVIPAGRTVELIQHSADVVHSFWPPRFAGKRDVFPGRETRLWFKADSSGLYPGPVRRVLRYPARADGVPRAGRRRRPSSRAGWRGCRRSVRPPRRRPGRGGPSRRFAPYGQRRRHAAGAGRRRGHRQGGARRRPPTRCTPRASSSSRPRAASAATRSRPRARPRR